MRRFILTSPLITGSVELFYTMEGVIAKVDFTPASPAPGIIKSLLQRLAAYHTIPDAVKLIEGTQATLIEADFEVSFDMFWSGYNKKINRKRAVAYWEKLSKAKQVAAWAGVAGYDKYLNVNSWRKKADPENYLRNEMWESEWT